MSEFSGADYDGDPESLRAQAIAKRLLRLTEYGAPIGITTREPNIPGVHYALPRAGSWDKRPYAALGSNVLTLVIKPSEVRVVVQAAEDAGPVVLAPEQIESVRADLPFGDHMPLAGRTMTPRHLVPRDQSALLAEYEDSANSAIRDTVETGYNRKFPGIGVIKTRRKDRVTGTFMISKRESDHYLVTSRTGFYRNTPVHVPHPQDAGDIPRLRIDMVDVGPIKTSLVDIHVNRHLYATGSPALLEEWLPSPERDEVFLYIVNP